MLPHTLARALVAYDAPDGRVIGAIDRGHAYQIVARFGQDWLQADVAGSGVVWLRTAEVFDLPAGLADLQPTAAPPPIVRATDAPAPPPSYQVESLEPAADVLGSPPTPLGGGPTPTGHLYGLTDADMDDALAAHQAAEAASCDRDNDQGAYCTAVRQWIEAHR